MIREITPEEQIKDIYHQAKALGFDCYNLDSEIVKRFDVFDRENGRIVRTNKEKFLTAAEEFLPLKRLN